MFKHILVPTDGSPLSAKAVERAALLAKQVGAKLTIITVNTFTPSVEQPTIQAAEYKLHARRRAELYLSEAAQSASAIGVAFDVAQVDDEEPYRGIIEMAQARGCDVVVMASHGRRGAAAMLLGSETMKVLMHSTIPVLVYR
jgi:nucleotide-binding universal stress UspA family protein